MQTIECNANTKILFRYKLYTNSWLYLKNSLQKTAAEPLLGSINTEGKVGVSQKMNALLPTTSVSVYLVLSKHSFLH